MNIIEEWVSKIKEGDLIGLLGGNYLNPVIFKTWHGRSSYDGYRAQYYWIPGDRWASWTQNEWDEKFNQLKSNDHWIHHTSTVNSGAERRFIPYPVELLCKNQKKFIKQFKHLKGYEY